MLGQKHYLITSVQTWEGPKLEVVSSQVHGIMVNYFKVILKATKTLGKSVESSNNNTAPRARAAARFSFPGDKIHRLRLSQKAFITTEEIRSPRRQPRQCVWLGAGSRQDPISHVWAA